MNLIFFILFIFWFCFKLLLLLFLFCGHMVQFVHRLLFFLFSPWSRTIVFIEFSFFSLCYFFVRFHSVCFIIFVVVVVVVVKHHGQFFFAKHSYYSRYNGDDNVDIVLSVFVYSGRGSLTWWCLCRCGNKQTKQTKKNTKKSSMTIDECCCHCRVWWAYFSRFSTKKMTASISPKESTATAKKHNDNEMKKIQWMIIIQIFINHMILTEALYTFWYKYLPTFISYFLFFL